MQEHDKLLELVLSKLQEAGWTLNTEKCQLRQGSIKLRCYVVSKDGTLPVPGEIEVISSLANPGNFQR